jgi:hypothetical protein
MEIQAQDVSAATDNTTLLPKSSVVVEVVVPYTASITPEAPLSNECGNTPVVVSLSDPISPVGVTNLPGVICMHAPACAVDTFSSVFKFPMIPYPDTAQIDLILSRLLNIRSVNMDITSRLVVEILTGKLRRL